jgi:hypothetical protein
MFFPLGNIPSRLRKGGDKAHSNRITNGKHDDGNGRNCLAYREGRGSSQEICRLLDISDLAGIAQVCRRGHWEA